MLVHLDPPTRALVRLAAAVAGATEDIVRREAEACAKVSDMVAVEEIILQSYLFAGFPRTLNAMRVWRAVSGRPPSSAQPASGNAITQWRTKGEETCATVYGDAYARLRDNIRSLHPDLDDWMIIDGYGKVLSRPGLDLVRRELAIVAACAATGQQRQLHSHFHGALNAGAVPEEVAGALEAISDLLPSEATAGYRQLLRKVIAARSE